jgi:universal stress protein A
MLPLHMLVALELDDLARPVLDYAVEIATRLDAKIHVLHAVQLPPLGGELASALRQAPVEELAAHERHKLECLAAPYASSTCIASVRGEIGDPRDVILAIAEQLGVDLIVMGSHGRRGVARVLLGSVAESVVRTAPCPVLLFREP